MEKSLKAVISDKIYLNYNMNILLQMKSELTYKVPSKRPGGRPELIQDFSIINDDIMTIPAGRVDLIPDTHKIVDKRTLVPIFYPEFKAKLRDSQQKIHDILNDNYIINAKPGWGKTFTAIAIAKKLGQKTLVVTHTKNLREQWEGEVEGTLGIKPGIIGGGKYDIDSPIVVSNIQSLVKHIDKLRSEFGTLIVDECHHVPATTFRNILDKSTARYKIGLSGTLYRKDGKHVLLFDYISKHVYTPPKENVSDPTVLIYNSDIKIPGNHMMPWATRINNLTKNPLFERTIINFVNAQMERGHSVLVLSDRVEFLERLHEKTPFSVCITGNTKNREELEDEIRNNDAGCLYGSINIYKEGISINALSCLVLATPIANEHLIVQLVGRIIRLSEGKLSPEVIDIAFAGETGKRQLKTRIRAYRSEGYTIRYINA